MTDVTMYYDFAEKTLTVSEHQKLAHFIDQTFVQRGLVLYLYGQSDDKTTLTDMLMENYPLKYDVNPEASASVIIIRDMSRKNLTMTPGENLDKKKNYIIETSILPDGVHPSKIVYF